jgi:DNA-directed RNA polymerase subunit M/transcription elongation factor TFIIS
MDFCADCGGILLPRKGKTELYCRVCDKTFKADKKTAEDYKIKSKITRGNQSKTAVIDKNFNSTAISDEERRAFEDFFQGGDPPSDQG